MSSDYIAGIPAEIPARIASMDLREREMYYRARAAHLEHELRKREAEEDPLHVGTRDVILNLQRECAYLREQLGKVSAQNEVPAPDTNPDYYKWHPSGVECIAISEAFSANLGQAIQYIWRHGRKEGQPAVKDLEKAAWFIRREIERLLAGPCGGPGSGKWTYSTVPGSSGGGGGGIRFV